MKVLDDRAKQIHTTGDVPFDFECEKKSVAGSVSQRACVFCGSRVVLYPIADAVHLIHGPIGCAAYTWDIPAPSRQDRSFTASASPRTCGRRM